jgi:hypothetical protein
LLDRSSSVEIQIRQVDPRMGMILAACDGLTSVASLCERFSLAVEDMESLARSGLLSFYDRPQSATANTAAI